MGPDAVERSDDLLAEGRRLGFVSTLSLRSRVDVALHAAVDRADHGEIGRLHVVRALVSQCHGDAAELAADTATAVTHLIADGDVTGAASAAAMAAVFTEQSGDIAQAMEHAVQALVLVDDVELSDAQTVRALMALSGLFMRLSSFEVAVDLGERAFEAAKDLVGVPIDNIAYNIGYVAAEATHLSADDPERRRRYTRVATTGADWLAEHGSDDVARSMLAPGIHAEIELAHGRYPRRDQLDAGERHYDDTVPDLIAWHLLLRGSAALRDADHRAAIRHLERAVPGLEASADNHCLVRALRDLAAAHAALDDHRSAYAVSSRLAETTRRLQLHQVGRLATQVVHRADLERAQRDLVERAARLADDVDVDPTTGARSRRWLERRLDGVATDDGLGIVLMFDLDEFKSVNDTHGHHVGDQALREFSELADRALGGSRDLARFGGEEFVVARRVADLDLDDLRHGDRCGHVLGERVRRAVEDHDWSRLAPGLAITVSVGVACGPLSESHQVLVRADDALLDSKRRGRNTVTSTVSGLLTVS